MISGVLGWNGSTWLCWDPDEVLVWCELGGVFVDGFFS